MKTAEEVVRVIPYSSRDERIENVKAYGRKIAEAVKKECYEKACEGFSPVNIEFDIDSLDLEQFII